MNLTYLQHRNSLKNGSKLPEPKKAPQPIAKKSEKKIAAEKEEKKARGENDTAKENWFKAIRKKLVGVCQCGCSRKSSKFEDDNFRASCCHIFPKAKFESVMYHHLNYVERNFWDGCHSNMDNQSMEKWPMFADFEDIKERFFVLAPLLTEQERTHKFYKNLEKLVYENA